MVPVVFIKAQVGGSCIIRKPVCVLALKRIIGDLFSMAVNEKFSFKNIHNTVNKKTQERLNTLFRMNFYPLIDLSPTF